ncbi:MAG: hypothetical protein ABI572_08145 [Actinomycetota bacterium]
MSDVHTFVGFAVVAIFAIGWLWGLGAWITKRGTGNPFWWWLTVAQVVAGLQALIGIVLLAMGRRPGTPLHFVYGFGPLLVLGIAHVVAREGMTSKPGGEAMKPWVPFAWAAFICFGLALRGLMTGLGIG